MGLIGDVFRWFSDPVNLTGVTGVPNRVFEHIQMSLYATFLAALVALPTGLAIGHTRRAEFLAVSIANVGRALPSLGILGLVFPVTLAYLPGIGFWPTLIALVLLAIPPILTNTYVGIKGVDADAVEAARGMGLSERQLLFQLELPLAAPLVVAGIRTSAVQVVATATLGALVGWGGLGRYIVDGLQQGDDVQLLAGAELVAALAIATEILFGLIERLARPRTARERRRAPTAFRQLGQVARPGGESAPF